MALARGGPSLFLGFPLAAIAIAAACSSSQPPPPPADAGSGAPIDAPSAPPDTGVTCGAGLTACGAACVDVQTDKANCGKCGTPCADACTGGVCGPACAAPTTNCGGTCVDLATSATNCKTCGNKCAPDQKCVASACVCIKTAKLSTDVQPVFNMHCAVTGCHTGTAPTAGLRLSTGDSYGSLVNKPASCGVKVYVAPSDFDKSYVVNKLTGVGMCGGNMMPRVGMPLDGPSLDLIRAWICNGALND